MLSLALTEYRQLLPLLEEIEGQLDVLGQQSEAVQLLESIPGVGPRTAETVAACARQNYHETAVVLDADGQIITVLRGDGAGIHTIDSAHDKAYTAVSFKNDTLALAARAKGEDSIAPLAKLPHVMFFGGGVVIKLNDEVIGSIGASGAPGANLDDGCAKAGLAKIRDQLK